MGNGEHPGAALDPRGRRSARGDPFGRSTMFRCLIDASTLNGSARLRSHSKKSPKDFGGFGKRVLYNQSVPRQHTTDLPKSLPQLVHIIPWPNERLDFRVDSRSHIRIFGGGRQSRAPAQRAQDALWLILARSRFEHYQRTLHLGYYAQPPERSLYVLGLRLGSALGFDKNAKSFDHGQN